ncbi:MAG TPA: PDZ domain-containing protein [Isosphaeraceae bacterium]|nr:PDZ domain-containing protein [Isosphaeraceae bacterium]
MFKGAANQPGNGQWSDVHFNPLYQPYLGAWSSDDMRTSGLTLAAADDALRAHLKLPSDQGLVVTGLNPHSSAGQSGIQLNDVLLTLGETPLRKPEDLEKNLKSVGEKPVTLQLLRAGKETKIQVQPQIQVTFRSVPAKPPEKPYWIGISVSPVDPTLRAQLQLPERQGLIVNEVVKDSPASRAEIKVNDILFELDGKPMSDSAKLVDIVQSHAEKPMVLHFIREGKKHWSVEVTPERRKTAEVNVSRAEQLYNALVVTRPGAVVTDTIDPKAEYGSNFFVFDRSNDAITMTPNNPTDPKQPADAAAGVSKRLDALDADIKQLRQAIEELSRATKEKK